MSHRARRSLGLLVVAIAGCTSHDGPVGDIDFTITMICPADGNESMHVSPDGAATVAACGARHDAVLDQAALDDLHAKVQAANFPSLEPRYVCTGSCPVPFVAAPQYKVTAMLSDRSYTVEVDSLYMMTQPDKLPGGLVATIRALEKILHPVIID